MMRDKAKSSEPRGCAQGRRLLEAILEERPSLEKETFLAHASSCSYCRGKLKLVEELRSQLAPQLAGVPESALDRRKAKYLRRLALDELSRMAGRPAGRDPRQPVFTLRHLAAGTLVLAVAFGVTLRLNRSASKDIFRDTLQAGQERMSPQGTLREKPSVFEWSPVAGATCYSFELIDKNLELLMQGRRSSKTCFTLDPEVAQKLTKDRTYIWTVKAYDDEGCELGERSADFKVR